MKLNMKEIVKILANKKLQEMKEDEMEDEMEDEEDDDKEQEYGKGKMHEKMHGKMNGIHDKKKAMILMMLKSKMK